MADTDTTYSLPGILAMMYNKYNNFVRQLSDPRTEGWFLVDGIAPLAMIVIAYYIFCKRIGPRLMRDREPFALKKAMFVYNLCNVLVSIWLINEGIQSGWGGDYNFICQPVDYSNNPQALRMVYACWVYYMVKLVELLDTVFFVLRKKDEQVTYLHMYHHMTMPFVGWLGAKFVGGGHGTLMGVINSSVHVVMYSYYLLAALGPEYQKYLWWKKYITALQMVQFLIIFCHHMLVFVIECDYPKVIASLFVFNAAYFFYLFGVFYLRTYLGRGGAKTKTNKVK